ncbi:U3 small nucleolar ribonucleoprotein protein IMP3 [Hondaea fermentalgiana]|uniref:U3 small nucleolar ribonucleoprotein protein IMP3 n=1 Tax=Hondaea fermentalgiana TaxID=2315210 RepID=A0A2R5GQK1_9STRA|nr:U3 small nucleolar ribonucleoprotein protein IMP3 [Hondaea fermentalgiana]|eukprot:GBG33152.1 U3 small nucleolar ribonucleoprotein protein IMP3 [Hondaea fermentalgiana]
MRELKYHEKKLLRKVDLLQYKRENSLREMQVMRRYHVQRRDDYMKYNKLVGETGRIAARLRKLDARDPFRIKMTEQLLDKLYKMGLITRKKNLELAEKLTVSAFCRRRLPVVLVRLKFAESVKEATSFVEQGQLRVGPEVITDPAFLVTRNMEDYITWVDSSKIRRAVARYNDKLDDYELLQE